MAKPELSVIIPCYKVGASIETRFVELLHQSWQNFELIIVLDGEDAEAEALCEQYRHQFKQMSIVRHIVNFGVNHALRSGLEISRGEFVVPVAGDDRIISKDFFKDSVSFLKQNECCSLVFSDQGTFEETKSNSISLISLKLSDKPVYWRPDEFVEVQKRTQFHIGANTTIYKKTILETKGPHLVELEQFADWFLNLSIAFTEGAGYIPKHYVATRIHDDAYSKKISRNWRKQLSLSSKVLNASQLKLGTEVAKSFKQAGVFPVSNPIIYCMAIISTSRYDLLSLRSLFRISLKCVWHSSFKHMVPKSMHIKVKRFILKIV